MFIYAYSSDKREKGESPKPGICAEEKVRMSKTWLPQLAPPPSSWNTVFCYFYAKPRPCSIFSSVLVPNPIFLHLLRAPFPPWTARKQLSSSQKGPWECIKGIRIFSAWYSDPKFCLQGPKESSALLGRAVESGKSVPQIHAEGYTRERMPMGTLVPNWLQEVMFHLPFPSWRAVQTCLPLLPSQDFTGKSISVFNISSQPIVLWEPADL